MIKEIDKLFKDYVDNSNFLFSYAKGDSFDIIKTGEDLYPQLFLETPWNIPQYGRGFKDVSFAILIIDLPLDDQSDVLELENKVEMIADLLIMELDLTNYNTLDSVVSANSIIAKEFSNDNCVVARIEITIRVLRDKNYCLANLKEDEI